MKVIVGAGLASARAIESLRTAGHDGPITLVGDEPHLPYDRPPLSKELLAGEANAGDDSIHPLSFYEENRVQRIVGRPAVGLDVERRIVRLDCGGAIGYDELLIATGSRPIGLPGAPPGRVLTLRTVDDAVSLRERLLAAHHVVIAGAGLIGLEVASVARGMNKRVVVVERAARPLERILGGHEITEAITRLHVEHGVELRTSTTIDEVTSDAVRLSSGEEIAADLVLAAIGVRPNTEWLQGTPIAIDDGVLVDELGRTNVPGVLAAGDVARLRVASGRSVRLESYGHAHSQGIAVGRTMAGVPSPYRPLPSGSSEQYRVRLAFVGESHRGQSFVLRGDPARRSFAAFFLDGGRVAGAFAMNRPRDIPVARRLIESGALVDPRELESVE